MLEFYFKYRGVLRRMRRGPLAGDIDDLAAELARVGYTRATARRYLSLVAKFSRYAERRGLTRSSILDGALLERFLGRVLRSTRTRSVARSALGHALRSVARTQLGSTAPSALAGDPDARLLAAFDAYLCDVRGLQPRSVDGVVLYAQRFLQWYRAARPGKELSDLEGQDILEFVRRLSAACAADATRSAAVSHVRALLRYLYGQGVLPNDLARLVPRVPIWRLATVPRYLAWSDVRAAIDSIDQTTAVGQRDRALMLLLATTGLRSQEVRRLELDDICWRTGEVHIRRTKCRRERVVPLLEEAGHALATYILTGRPRCVHATIFLCHVPPVRPIPLASTVASIVRRRMAQCGLPAARGGAHLLRHCLATRLVQQARPIKEVADLLGHRTIDTTAIYVKVALPQLARLALPFPGSEP